MADELTLANQSPVRAGESPYSTGSKKIEDIYKELYGELPPVNWMKSPTEAEEALAGRKAVSEHQSKAWNPKATGQKEGPYNSMDEAGYFMGGGISPWIMNALQKSNIQYPSWYEKRMDENPDLWRYDVRHINKIRENRENYVKDNPLGAKAAGFSGLGAQGAIVGGNLIARILAGGAMDSALGGSVWPGQTPQESWPVEARSFPTEDSGNPFGGGGREQLNYDELPRAGKSLLKEKELNERIGGALYGGAASALTTPMWKMVGTGADFAMKAFRKQPKALVPDREQQSSKQK